MKNPLSILKENCMNRMTQVEALQHQFFHVEVLNFIKRGAQDFTLTKIMKHFPRIYYGRYTLHMKAHEEDKILRTKSKGKTLNFESDGLVPSFN